MNFFVDNEFSSIGNSVLCLSIEGRGIEGIKSAIKSVSENVYLSGNAFDVNRKHFVIQKPYSCGIIENHYQELHQKN